MTIARGPVGVATDAELPFMEQDGIKLIRTTVRKDFSGDMVGTSEALMAAAYTSTPGSAGYVAIEHFTGSVGGKSGSFVLQHNGRTEAANAKIKDVKRSGRGFTNLTNYRLRILLAAGRKPGQTQPVTKIRTRRPSFNA